MAISKYPVNKHSRDLNVYNFSPVNFFLKYMHLKSISLFSLFTIIIANYNCK